jgi:hypothetical protein
MDDRSRPARGSGHFADLLNERQVTGSETEGLDVRLWVNFAGASCGQPTDASSVPAFPLALVKGGVGSLDER